MSKVVKGVIGVAAIAASFFVPAAAPAIWKSLLLNTGLLFATNALAQALAKKPRAPRPTYDVTYNGTVEPRRIVYGELKLSGMNVIPSWTSGDGNKHLHELHAVAGHQLDDITDVDFNQDTIADGNITAITGSANDGLVTAGAYDDKAWIRRHLGTDTQTADFILNAAFTEWTSNHRGRGVALVAVKFEIDDDVYQTGKPQVSYLVRGKRCYSARLDPIPGNDPTNASYIVYTTNPADILADYLIDAKVGCGIPTAKIDWDLVVAAADICDEEVLIPPAVPETTQKRYTCNVAIFVAESESERRENIGILAGAMLGSCYFRGGKYRMYAGSARASTFSLNEDDLIGKLTIVTELSANSKYNYVRGQFVDADRNYQLSEFEPRSSSTYESADGGRKVREVEFPACTDQYEAQRNAITILRRSRRKREVTGEFGLSAYQVRSGDVGTISLAVVGWAEQPVRCTAWKMLPSFKIEATFVEEDSSDWDDPVVGEYTVPNNAAGPGAGPFIPGSPQELTITGLPDALLLTWDFPLNYQRGTFFSIWEHTAATPFSSAVRIVQRDFDNKHVLPRTSAATTFFWITSQFGLSGPVSGPTPAVSGVPGKALSITTGFHAIVDRGSHHKFLVGTGSGTTTNTSKVTPKNGVAPFSYAWTRLSGSTSITALAASSATTGFQVTGMTNGQTLAAVFRCTVTDSTGGTPLTTTIDVSVSFTRDDQFGL